MPSAETNWETAEMQQQSRWLTVNTPSDASNDRIAQFHGLTNASHFESKKPAAIGASSKDRRLGFSQSTNPSTLTQETGTDVDRKKANSFRNAHSWQPAKANYQNHDFLSRNAAKVRVLAGMARAHVSAVHQARLALIRGNGDMCRPMGAFLAST
jgi:hypothetical protein